MRPLLPDGNSHPQAKTTSSISHLRENAAAKLMSLDGSRTPQGGGKQVKLSSYSHWAQS